MVRRVLDTSVVAKWFFEEEGTDRAEALLAEFLAGKAQIIVPSSLFYELANVLWVRRSSVFTERKARMVWAELMTFPLSVKDWSQLLPESTSLAFQLGITAYDAVFVGLAQQLGCDLVTADRTLFEKVTTACPWVTRL
jgi:predicted nucleic acid-binding protein